jgi:hypothetical protein
MPEHLPTPDASIGQLERAKAKAVRDESGESFAPISTRQPD